MILSSKTLDVSYTLHELTQSMAEQVIEKNAQYANLEGLPYQTAYLETAREVGWIETGPAKDLPRRHVVWIVNKLVDIWKEANTIPND